MARIPININKIKTVGISSRATSEETIEFTEFQISVYEKGEIWSKMIKCDLKELTRFRDEISVLIDSTTTAERMNVSQDQGEILDKHYMEDELCQSCKSKYTRDCITCLFILQSPLERKLFLALNRNYIRFDAQYPLNWEGDRISMKGRSYTDPIYNFKEVLTVVDFYIENRDTKLCIYTDGHSYHERTEEQAQHDKRIDRKLQELGFQVLRYTGKDVNESTDKIIDEIKKWL